MKKGKEKKENEKKNKANQQFSMPALFLKSTQGQQELWYTTF